MPSRTPWTLLAAIALLALVAVAPAGAAVYFPSKTADTADGACDADCSLREAIIAANALADADVILLGPGVYAVCQTVSSDEENPATGDLDLTGALTLVGASAESTILEGCDNDRILDVLPGAEVEILNVTVRKGTGQGPGGGLRNAGSLTLRRSLVTGNKSAQGGGIWTFGAGSLLTLVESTVADNTASGKGGGLAVNGPVRMTNSTISGNRSTADAGGGLYFFTDVDGELVNVTIAGNTAATNGGGLYAEVVPFGSRLFPSLRSSILAGNTAPVNRDCGGSILSIGDNLVGDGSACNDFSSGKGDQEGTTASPLDPKLGPLAGNGGPTPTHALGAGSPALNAGGACEDTDQRGQARDPACDTGAFEQGTACVNGGPNLCLSDSRFQVNVQWKSGVNSGKGQAVRLTPDTGYFWFFAPTNVELTVKVLNGCSLNNRFWVFLSGMTNVEVTVTVTDTATGQAKTYTNPANTTFRTRLDTGAFATCTL